jgi:hypothetical protein
MANIFLGVILGAIGTVIVCLGFGNNDGHDEKWWE